MKLWQGELDIELTQLDSLTHQMDEVVKQLEALGKSDPRIVRLRTIPGVGQSGETDRNGRITKRGNPLARTIFRLDVSRRFCLPGGSHF